MSARWVVLSTGSEIPLRLNSASIRLSRIPSRAVASSHSLGFGSAPQATESQPNKMAAAMKWGLSMSDSRNTEAESNGRARLENSDKAKATQLRWRRSEGKTNSYTEQMGLVGKMNPQ